MVTYVNAFVGISLAFLLGSRVLHWETPDIIWSIILANIAGLFALIVILRLETLPFMKKTVLKGLVRTWGAYFTLSFGILLIGHKGLRDPKAFLILILPLILSNGLMIVAFGPIQDRIVRNDQKRAKRRSSPTRMPVL